MSYSATCHCRATRITIPRLPEKATACTCTFCTKRGALWGYFRPGEVVIEPSLDDRVYAPSGVSQHHFCGTCGCTTWSLTPNWNAETDQDGSTAHWISVNLWLLDDVNIRNLPIDLLDGRNAW